MKFALPSVFNPLKPFVSCYGYTPALNRRERGRGPGSHFVYPSLFGSTTENGLSRNTGLVLNATDTVTSGAVDLSGWSRFALCLNFAVNIAVSPTILFSAYADPSASNLLYSSAAAAIPVGGSSFVWDSQSFGLVFTPYLTFTFTNQVAGAPITMTGSLFCYDYLTK